MQHLLFILQEIPVALQDNLTKELNTMERNGFIKRIEEPTDWVNSLVLGERPDGSLRICLHPRDLNKRSRGNIINSQHLMR